MSIESKKIQLKIEKGWKLEYTAKNNQYLRLYGIKRVKGKPAGSIELSVEGVLMGKWPIPKDRKKYTTEGYLLVQPGQKLSIELIGESDFVVELSYLEEIV